MKENEVDKMNDEKDSECNNKIRKDCVFISSTYLDNQERRKIVEDAILRAGMKPIGMERYTAAINPTVDECLKDARECEIYLGIIAYRYGWIPDGERSITEMESAIAIPTIPPPIS